MKVIILLLTFLMWIPNIDAHKNSVLNQISEGFGIPKGLLLTMCERESGPRKDKKQILKPKAIHDGGQGAGACGMKLATARLVLRRPVTKRELRNIPFTAVISARYLTDKRWCGRWKRWEARVLCYRVGHNRTSPAIVDNMDWRKMPKWWGTYKIFKRWERLHGKT